MSFLDNYEDVATRIQRFWATYPTGRIESTILEFNAEKGYVLIQCRVWRDIDDPNPAGTDIAFGNVATYNAQMKKFFCEDTSTSAIGRCIGLVLGSDKRPTAQNMAQTENIDSKNATPPATEVLDAWSGEMVSTIPTCKHGEMEWRTGHNDAKNKDWAKYNCSVPYSPGGGGEAQCDPHWYVIGLDGKWKPQS